MIGYWTNTYIGIPWMRGGNNRDGCDCWGLVRMIFGDRHGINIAAITNLAGPERASAAVKEWHHWHEVVPSELREGDVVMFNAAEELHTAVMIDRDRFIHADEDTGVRLDRLSSFYWSARPKSFWRHEALS